MSMYCKNCGQRIYPGEPHVCGIFPEIGQVPYQKTNPVASLRDHCHESEG